MNEDFKNNITYDDDWKSVSTAEYAKVYEDESELAENEKTDHVNKKVKKNKDFPKQYLITFQLIICIIIALIAFVLTSFGGDIYAAAHDWYYENLNKSVIFDIGDTRINLSDLFPASTQDEV